MCKPRILSDERAARVRREYWLGKVHSVKRIAERHGIDTSTVLVYARRQHKP
jgi:transposase-like protein